MLFLLVVAGFSIILNSSATVVFNREGKILPGQAKTREFCKSN